MSRTARLASLIVLGALLTACSGARAPTWTYPPSTGSGTGTAAAAAVSGGVLGTLAITAVDLGFEPKMLTVDAPGRYEVKLTNNGATLHDLTFPDGTKAAADAGKTATATVDVPAGGLSFLCSVPGHADAGMKGMIMVKGATAASGGGTSTPAASAAAAPQADPNAPPYTLFDPVAPALLTGTTHDIDMPIVDKDITVAKGFVVRAWTFGGQVPGPTIRVSVGDTVRVHLTNKTTMSHSIDFHASQTAMDHQMVEIKPGATWTYTFRAEYAGVWMYHCGTAPTLHHIANGMYGMVIVEPKGGLPKVDHEYAFVQSEWYLGAQGQPVDYAKAAAGAPAPDFVAFNGVASQYKDNPITVAAKDRIRVFVLDVGPNIDSSFHVVGTIFDRVQKEGATMDASSNGGWASQAVDLSPAQGAVIEFTIPEDGMYAFVTHAFNFVGRGAIGVFMAGG